LIDQQVLSHLRKEEIVVSEEIGTIQFKNLLLWGQLLLKAVFLYQNRFVVTNAIRVLQCNMEMMLFAQEKLFYIMKSCQDGQLKNFLTLPYWITTVTFPFLSSVMTVDAWKSLVFVVVYFCFGFRQYWKLVSINPDNKPIESVDLSSNRSVG